MIGVIFKTRSLRPEGNGTRRAGRVGLGDLKKEEEGFAGWGTSEIVVLNPPVGGKAPG